ncbi:hypothetical protein [Rhodobacter sp. NSM]|uniref:hypothetical protein n=1 Tax=Rhodobacter sp. NSM TaxID=3457501 RepID=UPI003FD3D067
MAVFVFGGSNSLRKGGWTSSLAANMSGANIVNRSIGAATSLMAIFRMLTDEANGPRAGDTVIWEYALNESGHVRRGYDADVALLNQERFIRECARRQVNLVAAIFTSRLDEQSESRPPLYERLTTLLDHYGVVRFDVSQAWRRKFQRSKMPPDMHEDNAHYALKPDLMDFIVEGVVEAAAKAVPPSAIARRHTSGLLRVQLAKAESEFRNSLIAVPLAAKRSRMEIDGPCKVIGVAALIYPKSRNALRVEFNNGGHSGTWLNISTSAIERVERPMLKVFSIEAATGSAWKVNATAWVEARPLHFPGAVYSEAHARMRVPTLDRVQDRSFVGLVLEDDA